MGQLMGFPRQVAASTLQRPAGFGREGSPWAVTGAKVVPWGKNTKNRGFAGKIVYKLMFELVDFPNRTVGYC